MDNDGYTVAEGDCDDFDATVYPGAPDDVGDDIDQNCDGLDGVDADADGYASLVSLGDDCDDADGTVHPGQLEVLGDAFDSDCDGEPDATPLQVHASPWYGPAQVEVAATTDHFLVAVTADELLFVNAITDVSASIVLDRQQPHLQPVLAPVVWGSSTSTTCSWQFAVMEAGDVVSYACVESRSPSPVGRLVIRTLSWDATLGTYATEQLPTAAADIAYTPTDVSGASDALGNLWPLACNQDQLQVGQVDPTLATAPSWAQLVPDITNPAGAQAGICTWDGPPRPDGTRDIIACLPGDDCLVLTVAPTTGAFALAATQEWNGLALDHVESQGSAHVLKVSGQPGLTAKGELGVGSLFAGLEVRAFDFATVDTNGDGVADRVYTVATHEDGTTLLLEYGDVAAPLTQVELPLAPSVLSREVTGVSVAATSDRLVIGLVFDRPSGSFDGVGWFGFALPP